jgi:hypothetical protein
MDMETSQHKQSRHAVARVAKLAEAQGLLPGAAKHDRQVKPNVRSTFGHRVYFKSLRAERAEFLINTALVVALDVSRYNAIVPKLMGRGVLCRLRGERIRARERFLRQAYKIAAVDTRANSESGHEDRGGRDETLKHAFSLIFEVIDPSEGESKYRLFEG